MGRPKCVLMIHGMVPEARIIEFMKDVQTYTGKNIGIMNSGGDIRRVASGEVEGRIRDWYEMSVRCDPIRSQHVGVYTTNEHPLSIELKTTRRNEAKGVRLLEQISYSISSNGGYVSKVIKNYYSPGVAQS